VDDCDEVLVALKRWKKPLCPRHYADVAQERDEAEERARQEEKQRTGSHYCVNCIVSYFAPEAQKRLNHRTYDDELVCPRCGELLTEIDPLTQRPEPVREESRRTREPRRPDTRLPRTNRREDDD
jgi:hypothetical protein